MIHDGQQALVVDPGDAVAVQEALHRHGLTLSAILVTHHHADHTGGIGALQNGQIPVYGPRHEAIAGLTHRLVEGDTLQWQGLHLRVWEAPGHTAGHIVYILDWGDRAPGRPATAFVGDTLFSGGCGRVFDGTLAQLHHSLNRLAALPPDTQVCPTHEYTLNNLRFAQAVEPNNPELAAYAAQCTALRAQHLPTLPTHMQRERDINPFLRCSVPQVVSSALLHGAQDTSPLAVFAALRLWKNTF